MPGPNHVEKLVCKICGYEHLFIRKHHGEPTRCRRCNTNFDEVNFMNIPDPDASPVTHNMYRWGCRECKTYGTIWLEKGPKSDITCPSCGISDTKKLKIRRIDPRGICSTIWTPVEGITRPRIKMNLPKKKTRCPSCGKIHHYLLKKPPHCQRCGYVLEDQENANNA